MNNWNQPMWDGEKFLYGADANMHRIRMSEEKPCSIRYLVWIYWSIFIVILVSIIAFWPWGN